MASHSEEYIPAPPPRPGRTGRLLIVLAVLIVALAVPVLAERIQYAITRGEERAKADVAREQLADLGSTTEAFRLVAQLVGPSVVHIDTIQVVSPRAGLMDDGSNFFGQHQMTGQGSGVIVDETGYILTNNHVIANASQLRVHLSDGRAVDDVQIVGTDPPTDLAVLKINASNLRAATWGDSNQLEVGDWVLAVGNPYGLDRSVTAGIVSAKRRRQVGSSAYQDFLQTDAAVNPGNSGGPLVNLGGEVVGINTAIVGRSFQGISFAIPSDVARDVYERIRESGAVARGWLGVRLQELTPELVEQLMLPLGRGALVAEVVPRGPAAEAGIEQGDVIVRWNGEEVADPIDLGLIVARTEIGSVAEVVVMRGGEEVTLEVSVGARPDRVR